MGWMSPEEIDWDGCCREQFRARLSGDIHSAGSIVFYILSGGSHCFGAKLRQQLNIVEGKPDFSRVSSMSNPDMLAVDIVARMVQLEPEKRLKIAKVIEHPFFWDAAKRLERIRGWWKTWHRGETALFLPPRLTIDHQF